MRREDCFVLGKITRKHSFKGEVVAKFDTDNLASYQNLESIFLDIRGELVPFFIDDLTMLPKGVRLKLEDVNSEQEAQRLVGCAIYLHDSMLPAPSEGELFIHEIIGYEVIDSNYGTLGKLQSVVEGVQDLFLVEHPTGRIIYIPWVKEAIVKEIDQTHKTISVNTPEGLVDLYLED
jgi:16S rRNA processing protein RimM